MRRIGGETPLPFELGLEPVEHAIERRAERSELIVLRRRLETPREIARFYPRRERRYVAQRLQAAPRDVAGAEDRRGDDDGNRDDEDDDENPPEIVERFRRRPDRDRAYRAPVDDELRDDKP